MTVEIVPGFGCIDEVKKLFSEYTDMLVALDPVFKAYLELQKYDDELLHLDKKYGPPKGRLLAALCDGYTAGCIALRPLDDRRCELKRLYVRPEFRGRGVARALLSRLIAEAAGEGYELMLLDTLPVLSAATALYESMGFYPAEKYNDSPLDYTVYMGCSLK